MYLHSPVLEVGSWWRVDTASGTNTPTTVYAHDGADAIPTALGASGSTVRGNTRDGTGLFWSSAATLYCKELTYQGVPTGTVVTSAGVTPTTPGGPPVDIATISTLVAALPTTYVQLLVTDATSTTLTGTLVAGHLSPVDCTAGAGARTLPAASSVAAGTPAVAKKADTTANTLTVQRAGSDLIFGTGSGATSKTLTLSGEAVTFVSNGVDRWSVESSDTPSGALATTYAPIAATPVASSAASGTLTAGAEHNLTPSSAAAWTLPTSVSAAKLPTTVKNNGTAAVTVARGGSDTINGGTTSVSIAAGEWARFTSDGAGAWTQSGTAGQSTTYARVLAVIPSGDTTGATDTAAIQAALTAANTAGGGHVVLAAGTYYVSTVLTLYSNTRVSGAGRNKTIIQAAASSNIDLVKSYQFDSLTGGNTSGGITMSGINDLTLDGNKANNPSGGYGVRVYGALMNYDRIVVRNCKQDGIYQEWSTSAVVTDGCESHLYGVVTHDNGNNGITWAGSHDSIWSSCLSFLNGAKGYHIKAGAALHVAIGCHSWGTTQSYAWYLEAQSHLLGCQGEGASVAQVMVGASDCKIEGGKYFGIAGQSLKGILVGDGSHTGPTGVHINTKTANCEGGAVDFTNAGSNGMLRLHNSQTGGAAVLVSPSTVRAGWFFEIKNSGSVALSTGDALNAPDSMTVRGGANALGVVGSVTVLNVNASSKNIELPNSTNLKLYSGNFSGQTLLLDAASGHIITGGSTPSAAVDTAAGTGATVSIAGDDTAGTITITTGTGPTTGQQATITFAVAFSAAPRGVQFIGESGSAQLLAPYTASRSTTAVAIGFANAPAASTAYTFNYVAIA